MLGSGLLTGLDREDMEWMEGEEVTSGENFCGDIGGVDTADICILDLLKGEMRKDHY